MIASLTTCVLLKIQLYFHRVFVLLILLPPYVVGSSKALGNKDVICPPKPQELTNLLAIEWIKKRQQQMTNEKLHKVWSVVSLQQIRKRFHDAKSDDKTNEPTAERGQWGNKVEFFLATLGYSVGIGNISRFPYVCMKNGGGAFLIPFLVALFAGGLPLFYVELALGQFSGLSPLTMWSFCPIFRGVGYACVLLSGIVSIYYNMLLAWCIFYLAKSMAADVPWRGCDNDWNSDTCYDPFSTSNNCDAENDTSIIIANNTSSNATNCNATASSPPANFLLPSEDFWNNVVLGNNYGGIENVGSLRWQLVLSLFSAWMIVFLCLMKGVQSSGKVVYVTAVVPYVLLTALMIRGVTLDGAGDGLLFYLTPNFTTLSDHNVWLEASLQMFYSLGPAWGGLITMASYNKFNHKFNIEAVAIPLSDVFTAIYGGFAIFSVIGFMAKRTKMPIKRFAASGAGLAFVVYPQAVAEMPVSPFWSILFFLTLLTLGIDSQFGFVDTVVSGLFDLFPKLRGRKTTVTAVICASCFVIGLPLCTEGGMYIYVLVDWYAAALTVTSVAFLESVIVAYIYGINRFSSDVKLMLGSKPNVVWKISFVIVSPLFMAAMLFVGLWNLQAPSYRSYIYPTWGVALGWLVALVSFAPIPGFAIYAVMKSPHKSLTKKFSSVFLPTNEWIPAKSELVGDYLAKHFKKKASRGGIVNDQRCVFCQELGVGTESSRSVKCESIFKCWVCFCTCRLFGVNKIEHEHKHRGGVATSQRNVHAEDKPVDSPKAVVNRGFSIGGELTDSIGDVSLTETTIITSTERPNYVTTLQPAADMTIVSSQNQRASIISDTAL